VSAGAINLHEAMPVQGVNGMKLVRLRRLKFCYPVAVKVECHLSLSRRQKTCVNLRNVGTWAPAPGHPWYLDWPEVCFADMLVPVVRSRDISQVAGLEDEAVTRQRIIESASASFYRNNRIGLDIETKDALQTAGDKK